jgi:hypothetical protein
MTKRLACLLAASLGIGGLGACAGSATGSAYGGGGAGYVSVTVRSPELVSVEDDLYVVADADEPVFYADDQYWLYRDDRWYRSRSYDRGYVYVESPPQRVRRIREPTAYVRYRTRQQEARRTVPTRDPWRDQYDRDDRSRLPPREQRPVQPTQPQQPAQPYPRPPQQEPVEVRDHRTTPPVPHDPTRTMPRDIRPQPVTPPRQVDRERDDRDRARDVRVQPDNRPATPPGQVDRDDRERAREERRDKREQEKADRKRDD